MATLLFRQEEWASWAVQCQNSAHSAQEYSAIRNVASQSRYTKICFRDSYDSLSFDIAWFQTSQWLKDFSDFLFINNIFAFSVPAAEFQFTVLVCDWSVGEWESTDLVFIRFPCSVFVIKLSPEKKKHITPVWSDVSVASALSYCLLQGFTGCMHCFPNTNSKYFFLVWFH